MDKISAGSFDINKWLFGGYEKDVITVIYGGPGTGKTNWCLLAAVSQAKKGKKVIYMDTEGGFSVERVRQISPDRANEALENILLLKPTNFVEQKKAFDKLNDIVRSFKNKVGLIVIDGMTILYRLDFASAREGEIEDIQKVNADLARQMRILAEIARKQNIPVLITNQVYNWEKESKMVAGDILRYWAKCLIELINGNGRRMAYLRKHRSLPEKTLEFQITQSGIKKRGWI